MSKCYAYSQTLSTGNSVNGAGVGDTTVTVDDVDLASNVINVGDIIQFSSTAATTDFDDGEFYRVTVVNTGTNVVTFVQHPRGSGGLKRVVADNAESKEDGDIMTPLTAVWEHQSLYLIDQVRMTKYIS